MSSLALTEVPTEALKTLLRSLHHGKLSIPVDCVALACHGLQDQADLLLPVFRDLDEKAVRAVLVAVLAERMK